MNPGNLEPRRRTPSSKVSVKFEVEDSLEEENGPLNKRSRISSTNEQQSSGSYAVPIPPSQYNPLNEPSPLGLHLRKSPSLLDLIQMRLSQGSTSAAETTQGGTTSQGLKNDGKASSATGTTDKLKASNFPASLLRIGHWEYKSRHEGDLVAKCYFAKHKLVWEVLKGSLKSKIEIQWSDIMGLKANFPGDGPGTLIVVLARQPLFFRETNPQPRKHTLWQATGDFTDGQASMNRQHLLQCPQGVLNKHFEKLVQLDMRLNFLSRQVDIKMESPYFEQRPSTFDDPEDKCNSSNRMEIASTAFQPSSVKIEKQGPAGIALKQQSQEAPSPSSVTDTGSSEGNGGSESSSEPRNWEEMKVPGLHGSISMSDLMNHIGHHISEKMTTGNSFLSDEGSEFQGILENIAQYLLSDTQFSVASDEKVMSRVNSLCCLLQDSAAAENPRASAGSCSKQDNINDIHSEDCETHDDKGSETDANDVSGCKQTSGMSRKDSFGDLLLHLPRIASLPKCLFNISEEGS